MTEPGDVSSPLDTTGDGPVTLPDRTEPGGQGSPDTNQGKAEPLPMAEPSSMTVGSGDAQRPSHPAALARTAAAPVFLSEPDDVPAGEWVETDVAAGAARMQARDGGEVGDSHEVPETSSAAAPGSSESSGGVDGIRTGLS